ncbi:MAG: glycosyltransferase family 39 protein [Chloroflexi bacterium]|nr:glycosyltransferase family 39 protein [Chloroflexota bacterium]
MSLRWTFPLVALALLAAFGLMTAGLQRESLWTDEAWSAWAVRSPNLAVTLERIRGDVHPPLYFLLLDGWTWLAGDSVFALRLPSALAALVGLAATYALGVRLYDRTTGLTALILLATASFFIYYAREARMYSLLLALAALTTRFYLRWRCRPTLRRSLIYAASLAALLYTHYAGALILLTHLLLASYQANSRTSLTSFTPLLTGDSRPHSSSPLPRIHESRTLIVPPPVPSPNSGRVREGLSRTFLPDAAPFALALLLFVPWLPAFLAQMRANPNGPLAVPVPTAWGTVATLVLILTSSAGWLFLVPFAVALIAVGVRRISPLRSPLLLLLLWLLLTPVMLLALNAWVAPVYQVRYTIAILPAGALLLAGALRRIWMSLVGTRVIVSLLLLALVYVQLVAYPVLWPGKPPWEAALRQVIAERDPLEPIITDFAPYSPAGYYDRTLYVRRGVALDLSWREHHAGELRALVDRLRRAPSVWVALPTNTARAWHIAALLDETHGAGYRSGLANLIFYRFDRDHPGDLRFHFGCLLRYEQGEGANIELNVTPGADVCSDYTFTALAPLDSQYSAGLHVVDITGSQSITQVDAGLGIHDTGETIHFSPCLTIPAGTAPGYYHLELSVYRWATGERLPVMEAGAGQAVNWGDVMRLAAVTVVAE